MSDLALIPAANLVSVEVFRPGGVDAMLARIADRARATRPDVSTPSGRKEIASLAYAVAKSKTLLDDMGKELVADWKARSSQVDAERRKAREFLDALKEEVRAPLTEYEQREEARVTAYERAISEVLALATFDVTEPDADLIDFRLSRLGDLMQRDWQEYARRADDAAEAARGALHLLRDAAVKRAEERAELARLRAEAEERERQEAARRQAEREARIAAEAAEKARRIAEERAEAERKAAEEARQAEARRAREAEQRAAKAERDRIEAERRAEDDARRREQEAIEAERRRVAEAKAADEAEARRRAENTQRRAKVNREVLAALKGLGIDEPTGMMVVASIVRGEVPHVSIAY